MGRYKHFVITLFNLRRIWVADKNNKETDTQKWLDDRFELFDKYCFPSVNNQINKDFVWLCLFDEGTPSKYIERVKKYELQCPQMVPCYFSVEDMENGWVEHLRDVIRGYMSGNDEYIITTNVDNDDMIHHNMVNRIQKEFIKNQKEGIYSMLFGYQYFLSDHLLLKMRYPHSHFLSLIEKNASTFSTIKGHSHGQMRKLFNRVDIKDEPYWIEVVHSSNVNNDLRITSRIKYYPLCKAISLKDFGIDLTLSKGDNVKNAITILPGLFIKTAIHKIKKKRDKSKK
ncbi:MAG: glycosyltransferase [Dysgonomonas sp.]